MSDNFVQKIVGMYADSRNYYRPVRDEWLTFYKQYKSIFDVDTSRDYYKWRSKLFIPATARAVDGLLPDLMLTLFGSNPFFEIAPREPGDVMQAKMQNALLSYQFDNDNIIMKTLGYLKQMGIYGTTFAKVFWKKDIDITMQKMQMADPITGQIIEIEIPEEVVLFDQPTVEPIDIFSIYFSQKATSLKDTWIIHRTEKTLREMKQSGIYENLDELERCVSADKADGSYEEVTKRSLRGLPAAYSNEEGDDRKFELLEYWNADRSKTCTIAGQRVLVRPERDNPYGNKYDPFVMTSMWPMPFELLGDGIPKKTTDLQAQINSEVNQRLDNRNLRQNMIIKVRRGANINTRNLLSRPGGIWLTDDMNAIDVVNIPDISSSTSFMEENHLQQQCEEITGVTKYATGAGSSGDRTATEASILTRMASKSFALHLKTIEETYIKPILAKFIYLNSKFMEKEQFIRVTGMDGAQFIKVTPGDVQKTNYDLIPLGSSQLTDKNLRVQQMLQYMQIIAQDPMMMGFKRELTRRIWEAWGNKDFDQIVQSTMPPPSPMGLPGANTPTPQGPPQGMGGVPMEPTDMRMPSPMEGAMPMMMGGGGMSMQ